MPPSGKRASRPPQFETAPLELTRPGKLHFVKLFKNGICQFDDFLGQLFSEGGYEKEVATAISIMDQRTRLKPLPGEKHHDLGTYTLNIPRRAPYTVRLYEIKTASLRIYYFHHPPDEEVVVLMGKKNEQGQDINAFTSLVDQYLRFIS